MSDPSPAEQSADPSPAEQAAEQSAGQTVEQAADQPVEQPGEQAAEQSAGQTAEYSAGQPVGQPGEQAAERSRRADRATRGALAGVLGLEAVVTLLVPRALAFSDGGLGVNKTVLLIALALLLIAAAGLLRRPWGIGLGTLLQVPFVLIGIWLIAMVIVGLIFAAVWARLLVLRRDLVGTPGGWRILCS
jgi:hypothetical protein